MKPLFSIIVPCYNQAEFLDECLQSVIDQTYPNWECIIVNDGSPDNTELIALEWTKKDSRFRYLKKENGGLSSARNAGVEIADGEWILPLDSDDKITDKYLELSINKIKEGYDLIYFRLKLFGSEDRILDVPPFDKNKILVFNPFYCSCIFPKYKWAKIGQYDENLKEGLEDWEFWINMICNTETNVVKIDYLGFFYRRKEISMNAVMNTDLDKKNRAIEYIIRKHAKHYAKGNIWLNETIERQNKYKRDCKKYENLFFKNTFGRLMHFLLMKING